MYRSPFRFIDANALPQQADALKRALALEKKKLLAEFELAGSATIKINGRELHRQDVLSLFEELASPILLLFHRAIWEDVGLLLFLEEGRIIPGQGWADNSLYQNTAFLVFISPHFADSANAFMQRALNGSGAAEELYTLQQNAPLMLASDIETAYRYATRFFTEKNNDLLGMRQRSDNGEQVSTTEIRHWCSDEQIHLLNRLPDAFSALRYNLANILNNLCVAFDRKHANKHALAAIERAATIRIDDEELGQLIPANLRIIRNKQSKGLFNTNPDTGRKTPKIGWVIVLFIIIIRMATAGDSCNEHRTDFHNLPAINNNFKTRDDWNLRIPALSDSVSIALSALDSILAKQPKYVHPLIYPDTSALSRPGKDIKKNKPAMDTTFRDIYNKAANDSPIILRPR